MCVRTKGVSLQQGPLAHREEQETFNLKVLGSRPRRPTNIAKPNDFLLFLRAGPGLWRNRTKRRPHDNSRLFSARVEILWADCGRIFPSTHIPRPYGTPVTSNYLASFATALSQENVRRRTRFERSHRLLQRLRASRLDASCDSKKYCIISPILQLGFTPSLLGKCVRLPMHTQSTDPEFHFVKHRHLSISIRLPRPKLCESLFTPVSSRTCIEIM